MAMTPRILTISALAVETGLDRRTVAARLKRIPPRGKDGKHDAWHLADLLGTVPPAAADDGPSFDEARRRKARAEAELSEIALARERGAVVEVDVVLDEVGRKFDALRARLLGIGAKVAARAAAEATPAKCKRLVDDAVREALEELSGGAFDAR